MGISPLQLAVILAIVILLFGTKRLKNLGSDLGSALKGFKSAVSEEEENKEEVVINRVTNMERDKSDV